MASRVISYSDITHLSGDSLSLDKDQSHHLTNVLRVKTGDKIEVLFLKTKSCFSALVLNTQALVDIKLIEEIKGNLPTTKVHLIVALIKPALSEYIVEKGTELGLSSINFFEATYHRDGAIFDQKKISRFSKIRDSALKQSKSYVLTNLNIYKNLAEAINQFPACPGLYFTLEQAPNIIEVLTSTKAKLEKSNNFDDLYLIVGPEGGLTNDEIECSKNAGAIGVSLGCNILKTETASIVGAGIVLAFTW